VSLSLPKTQSPKRDAGAQPDELTAEGLGWQLRAALPPMRLHSVSLCDANADVLWLSEGVLGPDEHGYATEAITLLGADAALPGIERDLEDGRAAVFLPVRAPQGAVVAIAMILIDGKTMIRGLAAKLVTPQVRQVLMRIAMLLKPVQQAAPAQQSAPAQRAAEPAPAAMPVVSRGEVAATDGDGELTLAPEETQPLMEALQIDATQPNVALSLAEPEPPKHAPPKHVPPALTSAQIDTILTLELTDDTPAPAEAGASAEPAPADEPPPSAKVIQIPVLQPAPAPPAKSAVKPAKPAKPAPPPPAPAPPAVRDGVVGDLVLSVQQLLKLRSGGRTRRYEVLLRSKNDPARNEMPHTLVQAAAKELGEGALDEFVVVELLTFLGANRAVWESEPSSFTVNLSAGAITDEGFAQLVEATLARTGVAPECLGFEIPQVSCVHEPQHVERFAIACEKLGCFLVLDDFTFDPRAVPLLRSKTLKLVKLDAKLTTAAMKDRVSQALVVAISQAAKVLGVHSVAKRVESQQVRQWLSATGIDFAQGFALEGPQALQALAEQSEG
jgi:EAL domain-containing protein (putative c-di-GMP-specific phosphodiesterase class I)